MNIDTRGERLSTYKIGKVHLVLRQEIGIGARRPASASGGRGGRGRGQERGEVCRVVVVAVVERGGGWRLIGGLGMLLVGTGRGGGRSRHLIVVVATRTVVGRRDRRGRPV